MTLNSITLSPFISGLGPITLNPKPYDPKLYNPITLNSITLNSITLSPFISGLGQWGSVGFLEVAESCSGEVLEFIAIKEPEPLKIVRIGFL